MTEKCPRCGGEPSRKQKNDGVSWYELPLEKQECMNCNLPCKFWGEFRNYTTTGRPPYGVSCPCTLVEVTDGDTVKITLPASSRILRIRLLDCWAAERNTCEGQKAKAALQDILRGAENLSVFLPFPANAFDLLGDMLTFGRILGHLFVDDGESVSERMVRDGHAAREKR